MESHKEIRVLNSNSSLPKNKRAYLTYYDRNLVPCAITEDDDSFSLHFDLTGLTALNDTKLDDLERISFLAKCKDLWELGKRYAFSMDPSNIYLDFNNDPKILNREFGTVDQEVFVKEYKSLAAFLLLGKYSYEDYLKGGEDLLDKDKDLSAFRRMISASEIQDYLVNLYKERKKYKEDHYEYVLKGTNKYSKLLLPVVSVLLVLSIVASIYAFCYKIPLQKKLGEANSAYLNNDYLLVESILADVSIKELPYTSQYILAISYIKSANLTQAEKQNELNLITTKTDENIFHYWIHIGRQEYEAAIDDAQRLNSNSHLYYAYLCYRDYTQNNMSISGEEKNSLLASIDEHIANLGQQLAQIQSTEETAAEEIADEAAEEAIEGEEAVDAEVDPASEEAVDGEATADEEAVEEVTDTEETAELEGSDEEVTDEGSDSN